MSLRGVWLPLCVALVSLLQSTCSDGRVLVNSIAGLAVDHDVQTLTVTSGIADDLLEATQRLLGYVRITEEPWGDERPRCICTNLAVWSVSGHSKSVLMVEPPLGSADLDHHDGTRLLGAVRAMAALSEL
eukprot:CAMPEP_0194490016 /NCGR_PEP_ID=MMETSP0253-20130528/9380_1 /TAXON_ID=2966 /ORGANISM="Noctiluca scintillans" /LENGTH=129 /DNA_ID=CAMNT_0039330591 /DNA_START=46 /DNA_END=435 /DNA_ORIENTATION=-